MKKTIIIYLLILSIILPTASYAKNSIEPIGERIVREAALWIGTPYGYADGSDGYGSKVDCSGLVMQVFKKFGIELPRTSYEQAEEGEKIPLNEMAAGDIVCFIYEDGKIGHVGIYVGGNAMIHSPRPEKTVEISKYFEDWGSIKSAFGRRIHADSDYIPEPLSDEAEKEISALLNEENCLKTDHLKEVEAIIENAGKEEIEDIDDVNCESDTIITEKHKKEIVLEINNPYMSVNDEDKLIDTVETIAPCIINNRTHLPLRGVAEEFGADVQWIGGDEKEIRVSCGDTEITLWIDSEKTSVNGQIKYIDSVPVIMYDRTFLPIRFIADELGWNLDWDGENQKISLSAMISEI